MNLAPVTTAGSVQSVALYRSDTDGNDEVRLQQNATLTGESYIWQPWFIRVRGRGSVAYDQTLGDNEGQALRGSAEGTISILPLSKFPATISFAHLDSSVEGDFGGADFTHTRVSGTFRAAVTQSISGRLNGSYDVIRRQNSGDLTSRRIQLNLTKSFDEESRIFGVEAMSLGASFQDQSFDATVADEDDADRQRGTVSFTMNATPFENVRYNSSYVLNYEVQDERDDSFTLFSLQSVSTWQWRPEDYPFILTGSLRGLLENIDQDEASGESDSDTSLFAGTVGVRWPVSDRLNVSFGVRGAYEKVERDPGASLGEQGLRDGETLSVSALASANYRSEKVEVGAWDWRWDARGNVDAGIREDGFRTRDSLAIGHDIEREDDWPLVGPVRLRLEQELDAQYDSDDNDPFAVFMTNGVSLSMSQADRNSSTSARLLLSDRRDLLSSDREFQIVQFRWTKRHAFDRDRSIQGSATAQAVRRVDEDDTDLFLTASGSVAYNHRKLFDVESLSFVSELRFNVIDLDELFGSRTDDLNGDIFRNDWRNVLRYRIGQLSAQLEATGFHEDDGLGYLFLVRVRRDISPAED